MAIASDSYACQELGRSGVTLTALGQIDRADPSGSGALNAGSHQIGRSRPFEPVFISNNVPYIERLEEGSSVQAPSGMLAGAVQRIATVLDSIGEVNE